MARIMPREYSITVNTFSELFTLTNLSDNMDITVLDASGDIRSNGGTVVYTYLADKTGVDAFIINAQEIEEKVVVEQENLLISGGKVTLSYAPSNGILLECKATWVESGINFVEDVIYNINSLEVSVDSLYDGKTLVCKYLRNETGKLVTTVTETGYIHTHSNKDFLDELTAFKTINGQSLIGAGDLLIGGATTGFGLLVEPDGDMAVDTSVIATKDDLDNLSTVTAFNELSGIPTTISGYGITDAYTKTEVDTSLSGKVSLTGNETIAGVKTFSGNILVTGTTKAAGYFYAGTTAPTNTTRLNYDGVLYGTQLFDGGSRVVTTANVNQTIEGTKTFSVSPIAPTPTTGDSSTKVATTAFVANAITSGGGGGAVNGIFYENSQTVSSSYTLATGKNAMTAGPISVANGVVITISDGSNWVVV